MEMDLGFVLRSLDGSEGLLQVVWTPGRRNESTILHLSHNPSVPSCREFSHVSPWGQV